MPCPYVDCPEQNLPTGTEACHLCRRGVKACSSCQAWNRAFANFCSACKTPFPSGHFNWSGLRGGPLRRSLNPTLLPHGLYESKLLPVENGSVDLDGRCSALLSWDGHLVAVAETGQAAVLAPKSVLHQRFSAGGPLSCHPCIERATLFLGREGFLTAFSLGALTLPQPRLQPRWTLEVAGRPIEALLSLGERLFCTLEGPMDHQEVVVVEGVASREPSPPKVLLAAERISVLAGDPLSGRVTFLSEEKRRISIHVLDTRRPRLEVESHPVRDLGSTHLSSSVIGSLGALVFATFGADDRLCQVGPGKATVRLADDVQRFALNGHQQRIDVHTASIAFPPLPHHEDLAPLGQVSCDPVILRDRAAAVGFTDGRVLLFDLQTMGFHRGIHLDTAGHGVTALASFGPYLAAGSARGSVAVYEVSPS